ncbi:MAG: 3'-5' exonuclease, partial [Calditrichaceae bacterium]
DHKNICVVGDEDQSIYGWRGADLNNILNFSKDFPKAQVFKLEENYRSNKYILDAANAVVQHNQERIGKNLWTNREEGSRIKLYASKDDLDEAKHIVEKIHDEMYTKKRSFKDIAVLYRTNAQSRVLEEALRKNAISYNIVGSIKFYDRKEIKDIIAYLKIIVNPADSISLKRVVNFPLRGIGDTTISKIEKFAEIEGIKLFDAMGRVNDIASISPAMSGRVIEFHQLINKFIGLSSKLSAVELVSTLTSETGIMHHYKTEYDQYESESRVANIKELFNSIEQFCEERAKEKKDISLTAFLEEVSLLTDVDTWNSDSNAVTLMTLHAAKGLEFKVVFVTGLEMNLLPLQRNSANIRELEEERRLLYVGMTRAEENLYLTYAVTRRKYNQAQSTIPSLFLDELPQDLIEFSSGAELMAVHRIPMIRVLK